MANSTKGPFSQGLGSLEYQFSALFAGVGGESAVKLLDALSGLNQSEQEILLSRFTAIIGKVASGGLRLQGEQDVANQAWEDGLFNDILSAFERRGAPQFGVIHGGKNKRAALLEFSKARRANRHSIPPDAA